MSAPPTRHVPQPAAATARPLWGMLLSTQTLCIQFAHTYKAAKLRTLLVTSSRHCHTGFCVAR